jgi:hypothetical protein
MSPWPERQPRAESTQVRPSIDDDALKSLALADEGTIRALAGREICNVIIRAPKRVSIVPVQPCAPLARMARLPAVVVDGSALRSLYQRGAVRDLALTVSAPGGSGSEISAVMPPTPRPAVTSLRR